MAVPKFNRFFSPVLDCLYGVETMRVAEIRQCCIRAMGLTEDDVTQMLPSEKQPTVHNRVHWALQYLKKAGLIASPEWAVYQITDAGRKAQESGAVIDLKYLEQFSSFREFHKSKGKDGNGGNDVDGITPVESF